ncbi:MULTISPECIES: nitroreductase family protein [unclassified Clostridioides]|uniref:nitroreductase family protein n=1 Tax=unclassified Clostridioides TaxID=2635829 RepID=UPI001D125E45|nr:nitroreductase family protein [Clostridioides sp. ZZV15-6388]MCC0664360.1 nitroreductase family protein [Clostridioides sp. ZZV15-6597]MCC0668323.1 nitroreductase family protein [Clostridioides sp. ZZV14-6153]MCC0720271.1 nitroreductase family protein [Clostridioides sp. ZZV14-6105]MCC0738305.1 nitroreductase family protein [Clostridioides sp. ZZV14-5902]
MNNLDKNNVNEVLDMLLRTRRSIRSFTKEIPSKELVEKIIETGRLAPYAILAVAKQTDFRHFFVISNNSLQMDKIKTILVDVIKTQISTHEKEAENDITLQSFITSLKMQVKKGVLGVGTAPYLIIVAERRGIPAIEQKSLSHVMQNMWLKATALGLGFELVSIIGRLSNNKDFCDILGIPTGEYGFDACTIGFSTASVTKEGRAVPHPSIKWI